MREIKFRGKRIDNGEWVYGYVYKDALIGCNILQTKPCLAAIMVDPSTAGQYTGLKDKNGREIFEGDIVKCINYHGEVTGHIDYEGSLYYLACSSGYSDEYLFNCKDFEVIDNIYDNPELLKEGSV